MSESRTGARSRLVQALQWVLALALVPGLLWLDDRLSEGRTIGPERNAVRGGLIRLANNPAADGVVVIGSSTARDWIRLAWLPVLFEEAPEAVLDAHVNGCHQGCAWAAVRRMLGEGRHFRHAIYGTNQYQMCEDGHSKRSLHQRRLSPEASPGPWLPHYAVSRAPLRWTARFVFGALSGAYADTAAVQRALSERWLGDWRKHRTPTYVRPDSAVSPKPDHHCAFAEADVAYKRSLSESLYRDLSRLADDVYIVLLPDRSLAGDPTEAVREGWERHVALQRELAAAHPNLHLIDVVAGTRFLRRDFKDSVHLTSAAGLAQRRRFGRLLREGGHVAARAKAKPRARERREE